MSRWDQLLGPSSTWLPLLEAKKVVLNQAANRISWAHNGQFAAALSPSLGLAEQLAKLPTSLGDVINVVQTTAQLSKISSALQTVQLISTVGAVASVAGVAVSIAGFAAVLHRLDRIEGKLDQMLTSLDELKRAVNDVGGALDGFFMARLAQARDSLERSLKATTERERLELARDARRLFQEARHRYFELWKRANPWLTPQIPLATARELQGRYVACAIGELYAELILGDEGAMAHSAESAAKVLAVEMSLPDGVAVLRRRSDWLATSAGHAPAAQAVAIAGQVPALADEIKLASAATTESARRLHLLGADSELPKLLGMPGHEILLAMRAAPEVDVYALGRLEEAA